VTAALATVIMLPRRVAVDDLETLIARAQRGDQEALAAALTSLLPMMTGYARRTLGSYHDGEDAVGDAVARICRMLHRYDPDRSRGGGFTAWAFTLLRHAIADFARKRPAVRETPEHGYEVDPTLGPALTVALRALPEAQREAFLLHHAGFAYAEIATFTSVPIGTVRSRIHAARCSLREALVDPIEGSHAV
jgi:RNA polymerase sigma-70 factor (ECF subfamily)